jgi:hypothetical protein
MLSTDSLPQIELASQLNPTPASHKIIQGSTLGRNTQNAVQLEPTASRINDIGSAVGKALRNENRLTLMKMHI